MLRVGIVGIGMMGRMHLKCYRQMPDVKVVALCDIDKTKLNEQTTITGNLRGAEIALDLTGADIYYDFEEMLAKANLDAVSITVPTHIHKDYTVMALNKGIHVLCEKPMALDEQSCDDMAKAAEKSGMVLQIGHCLRFWPEYIKLAEIAKSGEYGELLTASFKRLSAYPRWSWNNWLMKENCSGGALLDLHIHDSDFIQYLFGMPKSVNCKGIKGPSGGFDHVLTDFSYGDKKIINAEASWMMPKSFGFEMNFHVMFEKATVIFSSRQSPTLQIFPAEGEVFSPGISDVSGHMGEIKNFVDKIKGLDVPSIITPRQSLNSVRIVLAERESAKTSREVVVL